MTRSPASASSSTTPPPPNSLAHACTAVDTRHNINNPIFIDAAYSYATWTGDTNFLALIIPRLRSALSFALSEFRVREYNCVFTPWLGHDGTSGISYEMHGTKHIRYGYGIGNNYYDLLPFGGKDAYATIYLYNALRKMAALEMSVAAHPEWRILPPPPALAPQQLLHIAHSLKSANTQFWNYTTGRFATLDFKNHTYDYGFVFLNCEAIACGFATPSQAESIIQWLEGSRIVTNDTSKGPDIYHWEFGPRATTRRNIDYYSYGWTHPELIPFGGQIQDGGAVLGFSYHDLISRLITRGPDNAWQRLQHILNWFDRVQSEGGYRAYYKDNDVHKRGSLQGGGTAGGLGLDCEFLESLLVPQIMLYGFLGFHPRMDGFALNPRLPSAWPSLYLQHLFPRRHPPCIRNLQLHLSYLANFRLSPNSSSPRYLRRLLLLSLRCLPFPPLPLHLCKTSSCTPPLSHRFAAPRRHHPPPTQKIGPIRPIRPISSTPTPPPYPPAIRPIRPIRPILSISPSPPKHASSSFNLFRHLQSTFFLE